MADISPERIERAQPCPFCGGAAEIDYNWAFPKFDGGTVKACYIYCTSCEAGMSRCHTDHSGWTPEEIMGDLLKSWNKRSLTSDASAIEGARAEEREACARIADDWNMAKWAAQDMKDGIFPEQREPHKAIAAAIRSRTPVAAEADKGLVIRAVSPSNDQQGG